MTSISRLWRNKLKFVSELPSLDNYTLIFGAVDNVQQIPPNLHAKQTLIWITTTISSEKFYLDGFRRFDVKHAFSGGVTTFSAIFLISGIESSKLLTKVPAQFLSSVLEYGTYVSSSEADPSAIDPSLFRLNIDSPRVLVRVPASFISTGFGSQFLSTIEMIKAWDLPRDILPQGKPSVRFLENIKPLKPFIVMASTALMRCESFLLLGEIPAMLHPHYDGNFWRGLGCLSKSIH